MLYLYARGWSEGLKCPQEVSNAGVWMPCLYCKVSMRHTRGVLAGQFTTHISTPPPQYTMAKLPNPSLFRLKQKWDLEENIPWKIVVYRSVMLLLERTLRPPETAVTTNFVHLSHVLVLPIQKLYGDKLGKTRQQIKLHGMCPPRGDHCLSCVSHTGKSQQGKRLQSFKHFRICSCWALMKTSFWIQDVRCTVSSFWWVLLALRRHLSKHGSNLEQLDGGSSALRRLIYPSNPRIFFIESSSFFKCPGGPFLSRCHQDSGE